MGTADLRPAKFPQVTWTPGQAMPGLEQIFAYVIDRGKAAHQWYVEKWFWRRRIGCFLRYLAIVATAVGGVLPAVSASAHFRWIDPVWATVILAGAGLLVAIDKLGGFTSGWVRYVLAGQEIDQAVENFRFSWETEKLKISSPLTNNQMQAMLSKCQEFLKQVQGIVKNETDKWATEFQAALTDVEQAAKAAAAAAKEKAAIEKQGGINLEVENGSLCAAGWELLVNNKTRGTYQGNKAVETDLKPGPVKIEVKGKINNQDVRDSLGIIVKGGEFVAVKLKLQ